MVDIEVIRRDGSGGVIPRPRPPLPTTLREEVAIVQHTYVDGKVDMYFDFALFKRILEFVQLSASRVEIVRSRASPETCSPVEYLSTAEHTPAEDREPPDVVIGYSDDRVVVVVETEHWWLIGGPEPYADSYTYALHSDRDLSKSIVAHLSRTPEIGGWNLRVASSA